MTSDQLAHSRRNYRDPDGDWFGLTTRARRLCLEGARDADPDHLRRTCRSEVEGQDLHALGQHVYNIGLVRVHDRPSRRRTREMADGAQEQSRPQAGRQRPQPGEVDLGRRVRHRRSATPTTWRDDDERQGARAEGLGRRRQGALPQAADRGTHVNISGMALAKNAPNKDNALKLMEFLVGDEAQKIYAEQVFEYPVRPGAEPSDIVKSFGTIKPDTLPLTEIAKQPQGCLRTGRQGRLQRRAVGVRQSHSSASPTGAAEECSAGL